MRSSAKLTPNLEQHEEATKMLNLRVLQRMDPLIKEILITAAHVTFYRFNILLNQWSRKNVEGSLFVVKRNGQPRFQFIVMNRRSTENLVGNILGDFEFEVQVPYLLYRNGAQEVNGIWFYDSRDCEEVGKLFYRITNAYSKVPPKLKVPAAKSRFEELEVVPVSVIEGPLDHPPPTTSSPIPDSRDDSFMNFFTAAMNRDTSSISPNSGQPSKASSPIPIPSRAASVTTNALPAAQPANSIPSPGACTMPVPGAGEPGPRANGCATNLVKPSLFSSTPPSSAMALPPLILNSPPLLPGLTMQRPYGTPLLQPFPPPTPSPSLTPQSGAPGITRDKVRDALQRLVQNDCFIEMVYMEMQNAHCS